ncbi:MAG: hypothetical protein V1738_02765 [Patescibacteria group bacterium]
MTRPVRDTSFLKVLETFRVLAVHPEFTDDLAVAIRRVGGADRAVGALRSAFGLVGKNPFEISVEATLYRFRAANGEPGCGIAEDVIAALAASAPEWPEGRLAFRSLRIRWGEGDEGAALTFERHVARIERAFGPRFWRWEYLRSDKDHLRLLAGNATHRPAVEWVTFDLGENREHGSVATTVRGSKLLTDEGLAFCWLFPEYIRSIDRKENPAFFLAGYELNVPEDGKSWLEVPVVDRCTRSGEVNLSAGWRSAGDSGYSVPSVWECRR